MENKNLETATLGAGCFWCVEAVFDDLKGVEDVVSGYSGGHKENPTYQEVCSETTGHAEVVQIKFNPDELSFGDLLRVYFTVHDPTQLNRQGPDVGEHYRSEIFFTTEAQKKIASAYIGQLGKAKVFKRPIVTKLSSLGAFTVAEDYHQNYAFENPNAPYIRIHDAPKVAALKKDFASIYREDFSASK